MRVMDVPTYSGIERWYRQIFKKAGWVVLHLEQGNGRAAQKYLESIDNFIEAAKKKNNVDMPKYMSVELRKMISDVETLKRHMAKDVVVVSKSAKRKTKK